MRETAFGLMAWLSLSAFAVGQPPQVPALVLESPSEANCFPAAVPEAAECFYVEAELLLRWFKPVCASVPVLTIGNPNDARPGAVGQGGTTIVVGGSPPHKFEFPMTPGAQVTLGWNRGDGAVGFEVSGFLMSEATNRQFFAADANGAPFTYLPYLAPNNTQQALPFTIPGVVTGSSEAVGSTQLWGSEADCVVPFTLTTGDGRFYGKFLVGARYLNLRDEVRITNVLRLVDDPSAWALGMDTFQTHNQFGGAQVGTTLGVRGPRFAAEFTLKLAAGLTWQQHEIQGSPLLQASVVSPLLVPGPFLALPTNVGTESARRVTLVPEIGVKTQVALTDWCSFSLGYSLLYWNKVLCPGDQMSANINITQVPFQGPLDGPPDPKPKFVHTDYFVQGLSFGVEFSY